MDEQADRIPGLEYVVEKLADCTELLARVEAEPETPERERLRDELKAVQRRLLSGSLRVRPGRAHLARAVAVGASARESSDVYEPNRLTRDTLEPERVRRVFFSLSSWQLALVLTVIMFGATLRRARDRPHPEPPRARRCASRSARCRRRF